MILRQLFSLVIGWLVARVNFAEVVHLGLTIDWKPMGNSNQWVQWYRNWMQW